MYIKLIKKMTEQELLSLEKGDVFYRVNPFSCTAGNTPYVEEITLISDWSKYESKNLCLSGVDVVNVRVKFISDELGLCEHESRLFLKDSVSEVKGNFVSRDDAERFARFSQEDIETIDKVNKHHNWCKNNLDCDF